MKYFGKSRAYSHVLGLIQGEDVIQTMIDFCAAQNIKSGFFQGIGAVSSIILTHYRLTTKRFGTQIFNEPLEIVSLMGIIARKDGKPYIHCHGSFSDSAMRTYGGHVKEAIISGTGEIIIRETKHGLYRTPDEKTGLNLLHSKKEKDLKFSKHAHGDIGP